MQKDNEDAILRILQTEIEGLSLEDIRKPFARLGIDSFGLISLRARLEQYAGHEISDDVWTSAKCPADIFPMVLTDAPIESSPQSKSETEFRSFNINMPQMAMSGLSESWLLKELGDMHWNMITDGLGSPSSELVDGSGSRLYATFTRISFTIKPLSSYAENTPLILRKSACSRYGGGIYFSEIDISPGDGRVQLMSSFTKRGEGGSNLSLQKGQPTIPESCQIPCLTDYPLFAEEYRARKGKVPAEPIFEIEYEIVPQHDINGVGLLYFAAYPMISDICLAKHINTRNLSTVRRDIFYFGNCDENETLVFRLHKQIANGDLVESETSISRKSDGTLMAYLMTAKQKIG